MRLPQGAYMIQLLIPSYSIDMVPGYYLGTCGSEKLFRSMIEMVPEYDSGAYGVWIPFETKLKSFQDTI